MFRMILMTTNRFLIKFYVTMSLFGILIVLILALDPPLTGGDLPWRRPIIGSSFAFICILGAFASLFPKICTVWGHSIRPREGSSRYLLAKSRGHHPECEYFSSHIINVNGHALCAGCTGLFVGALLSLAGALSYFFFWFDIGGAFLFVVLGGLGLIFGFAQFAFKRLVRSAMNVLFVVGAFSILMGVDQLAKNFFVDLFLLALIVFWILTRIELSQWDHERMCERCRSLKKECELRGESISDGARK